jgi:hypothetical protein
MKRCPTCDLVYNYELLQFCRFDGARLVDTYRRDATTRLLPPQQMSNQNARAHIDHRTGELRNRAR